MFRSVLAGFDATDQGRDALALAWSLTDPDGDLVVCCVFPPDPPLVEPLPATHRTETEAQARLEIARGQLGNDPRVSYVGRGASSAAAGLHAEAEARGTNLLVVGSSHRGAVGRILPGSVTRQVLQAAPCAVAIAPRGYHDAPVAVPRRIGVAYDGSEQADVALHVAATLARRFAATVTVIGVVDVVSELGGWAAAWSYGEVHEAELASVQARVDEAVSALREATAVGVVRDGGAADELVTASADLDLLVVGSRNYGPLRRALLGSVSGRVAEHAHCPVLVVPRHAAEERAAAPVAQAEAAG